MAARRKFVVRIFFSDRHPADFIHNVTNLEKIFIWCKSSLSPNITAMDVYSKKTNEFLVRVHSSSEAKNYYNSLSTHFE